MSLLLNILSRLLITFLPRSKHLNFMAAVTICSDFGAPQNKVRTVYTVSPSICHEVINRVPEELWTEVRDIVQETGIKTIPKKKK